MDRQHRQAEVVDPRVEAPSVEAGQVAAHDAVEEDPIAAVAPAPHSAVRQPAEGLRQGVRLVDPQAALAQRLPAQLLQCRLARVLALTHAGACVSGCAVALPLAELRHPYR